LTLFHVTRARLNDLTAPAKEAKSFDAWFFAQPKKVQEKMRENGVLPYREMSQPRHVFEIKENHTDWTKFNKDGISSSLRYQLELEREKQRTEVDAFISRDHVGIMLKAFMDAIAHSDSMAFRRHVELCRWALSLPGCLSSRLIGKMYGRSHFWMRARAKEIQRTVNSDACGLFPHVNARRGKNKAISPPPPATPNR
jgi:hypothetical protein